MSALFVVACLLSASPDSALRVPAATVPSLAAGVMPAAADVRPSEVVDAATQLSESMVASNAKSRTLPQWQRYVSEMMTRTAVMQKQDPTRAADEALRVYRELLQATQLPAQDREQLRLKLRSRLLAQQQKLVDQVRGDTPTVLAQQLPPARPSATTVADDSLGGQLVGAVKSIRPITWTDNGGPGVVMLWGIGGQPAAAPVLAQQIGGFGGFGGRGAFGGQPGGNMAPAQPADHSKELIDVIQSTVAPQSWEANGGPGTIRYFAPVQALIIRQTGEVHDQLGGLLNQVRK